jgi:hypothetical protein
MGMAVFNVVLVALVLRFQRMDGESDLFACLQTRGSLSLFGVTIAVLLEAGIQPQTTEGEREGAQKKSLFRRIFLLPEVHLLTAILFLYAGVAVTVGGGPRSEHPPKH